MVQYYKFPAESDLGTGIQYIEFDDEGWPIRQAECYEDRWFNSDREYHPELGGMGLCDQKLSPEGIAMGDRIDYKDFEKAWNLSHTTSKDYPHLAKESLPA
jgi:hypothetical protein